MSTQTLPPWPDEHLRRADYTSWEQQRAAFYESRLRVAVATLRGMITTAPPETLEVNHRYCVEDAREALALIGELPSAESNVFFGCKFEPPLPEDTHNG